MISQKPLGLDNAGSGMFGRDLLIREYYAEKRNRVITCPYQPGNLKISEKACLKRHQAAVKKRLQPFKSEDLFNFFVSQSLIRCESCPMIKKKDLGDSVQTFSTSIAKRGNDPFKRRLSS
jgi:hypothetical protein